MDLHTIHEMTIIQPEGRLDATGGESLRAQLSAIAPKNHPIWLIDLANVNFIDSAGLAALASILKSARDYGCRLFICNVQQSIRLIFEITGLDQVFEILDADTEMLAGMA